MAGKAVGTLLGASAVCFAILLAVFGAAGWRSVLLGSLGPLAAALGTWLAVRRTHQRTPGAVPGVLIKLFGAKLVAVAAYLAFVLLLLIEEPVAFVVSFTCQYILLHVVQAVCLRRLAAAG